MKTLLCTILLLVTAGTAFAGDGRVWPAADPVPDEYIVVLADQGNPMIDASVDILTANLGGTVLARLRHGVKAFGIRLRNAEQAGALAANPLVHHVEQNGRVFLSYSVQPNTPPDYTWYDDSWWHLDRIDNIGAINPLRRQYAYTSTGAGVRAYLLGTGVLGAHQDFGGRVETGATYADSNPANWPCGTNVFFSNQNAAHDTAVASVLGGTQNGVAKGVTIVPVKVFTCEVNPQSNLLWWCWGLDWVLADARAHPANRSVVNISGGYPAPSFPCMSGGSDNCVGAFEYNVAQLVKENVVVVAAANNQNQNACNFTPSRMGWANYTTGYHVITVGGTTIDDQRWVRRDFCSPSTQQCNIGVGEGSNIGACVDIYAPAERLQHLAFTSSTTATRQVDAIPGTPQIEYSFFLSGTSYAAPIVAGIAARILQANSTLTPYEVWNQIKTSALDAMTFPTPRCFDGNPVPGQCNNSRLAYVSPYQ